MSQKISQLPSVIAANIQDTDIVPLVATNVTSKVTIAELRVKLGTQPPTGGRTVTSAFTYLTNNAVYNIKDFGAFGDGVTNDAVAIAACYAATPDGGTMLIPIGAFLFNVQLVFDRNVSIIGLGPGSALVPNLGSTTVDAIVINSSASNNIWRLRFDNFAILSSHVNAGRDAIVFNRLMLSEVNIHVKAATSRYGVRFNGGLENQVRIISSVNVSDAGGVAGGYPYVCGFPASSVVRIQYDGVNNIAFNSNHVYVDIAGGAGGVFVEDQHAQGNNFFYGTIQGSAVPFYALNCIGLALWGIHFESNTVGPQLEQCSSCTLGGGMQVIPAGASGKLTLTTCDHITLDSIYLDNLTVDTASSMIQYTSAFRYSTITDPGSKVRNSAGAINGQTASTPSATPVTLIDGTTRGAGHYTVSIWVGGSGSAFHSIAEFTFDGATLSRITGTNAASSTITLSGNNIQATQTSGSSLIIQYVIEFIPFA